jgi:hypothetical protein
MARDLESVRRQSIQVWSDVKRRALHEAVKNTPVTPPAVAAGLGTTGLGGGGGTGGGGSLYTEPVDLIYALFRDTVEDVPSYHYSQFSLETNEWTVPISFDISPNIYDDYAHPTNGYGIGFEFQNDDGGDDTILSYVNSKGELAWTSGSVVFNDYDVDPETAVGLVSFFMENDGAFEIKTFYRDIEQTFTFDNYEGNTSFNLDDNLYGTKSIYRFGNLNDGNLELYALDVLTGEKTLLYTPQPGCTVDYYQATYPNSTYVNMDDSVDKIIVISANDDTGATQEIKVIDYSGNVLQDIGSQFLNEGFDISNINYFSSNSQYFGKYETTGSSDDVYMYIKYLEGGVTQLVYFGIKEGAIWYQDDLPSTTYVYSPFNGNNLLVVTQPENDIAIISNMIYGIGSPLDVTSISPSGVQWTIAISTFAENMSMLGSNIFTFSIGEGTLQLLTWNTSNNDLSFESVAVGESFISESDVFYANALFVSGNLVNFIQAFSDDSGNWTFVYRNSLTGVATDLLTTGNFPNYYESTGLPLLVEDNGDLYRVNQTTNDLTLVSSNVNTVLYGNSTWKTNSIAYCVGNDASGDVFFIKNDSITAITLPSGASLSSGFMGSRILIIDNSDDVYVYTNEGSFIEQITTDPDYTEYSDFAFWRSGESNETANVYTNSLYSQNLGTFIYRINPNDEWW